MPVVLSMLAGAGAQFFDNNGNPLSGGLLYTYAAGTTTPQTTYTSSTGLTAHLNPIVLDAAGRVNQIWVDDALYYKFVLQTPFNVTIATYDNLYGPAAAERTIELDSGNNIALPNNLTVAGGLVVAGTTSLTGAVTAASPITLPASDPTLADQAARKAYVDAQDALRLALIGGTLSGPLTLHADPSAALGAATKQYVDSLTSSNRQVFTAGGTWTKPSGYSADTLVLVECWGAGGGGSTSGGNLGGGGGGGAYNQRLMRLGDLGATETVTIGGGGAAGGTGGVGGTSSFGAVLEAFGGGGGAGGSGLGGGGGGGGLFAAGGNGTATPTGGGGGAGGGGGFNGGAGGDSTGAAGPGVASAVGGGGGSSNAAGARSMWGGGGGGSGASGAGGVSTHGGAGGTAGTDNAQAPGGGGGRGQPGARGEVRVTVIA
jgi:hypothetical protein